MMNDTFNFWPVHEQWFIDFVSNDWYLGGASIGILVVLFFICLAINGDKSFDDGW